MPAYMLTNTVNSCSETAIYLLLLYFYALQCYGAAQTADAICVLPVGRLLPAPQGCRNFSLQQVLSDVIRKQTCVTSVTQCSNIRFLAFTWHATMWRCIFCFFFPPLNAILFVYRTHFSKRIWFYWFQTFAVFWILYVFFWVFPRRPIVVCRHFGTLYQFHLQGLDVIQPLKMELIRRQTTIGRRGNTQKNTYKNLIFFCIC